MSNLLVSLYKAFTVRKRVHWVQRHIANNDLHIMPFQMSLNVRLTVLCFGEHRKPIQIVADRGIAAILTVARSAFGDAISVCPLVQTWNCEWDSWVDLADGDEVLPMTKIRILPQPLEDLGQVRLYTAVCGEWLALTR